MCVYECIEISRQSHHHLSCLKCIISRQASCFSIITHVSIWSNCKIIPKNDSWNDRWLRWVVWGFMSLWTIFQLYRNFEAGNTQVAPQARGFYHWTTAAPFKYMRHDIFSFTCLSSLTMSKRSRNTTKTWKTASLFVFNCVDIKIKRSSKWLKVLRLGFLQFYADFYESFELWLIRGWEKVIGYPLIK